MRFTPRSAIVETTKDLLHAFDGNIWLVGKGQFCDYCNGADPSKAHPITNAIDGTESWWQSPPLSMGLKYNEVNVTLDLGQLFHVAYILIKFANSPRPDLWVLERSVDFGKSYVPWQYFAYSRADCLERFGKEANLPVRRDSDVLCTTEYSRIVPLENGEIVVSLVNGRPGAKNFTYSPGLQEFTKATNIRLRFLRTNTLLGHLISKAQQDPTVTRRYYYSIKDISIGGRCVCHGHAEVCSPKSAENQYQDSVTMQDGFSVNVSITLVEKPVIIAALDIIRNSGNLQQLGAQTYVNHNTAGINCEKCAKGYYRPYGVPVRAPDGCIHAPVYASTSSIPSDGVAGDIIGKFLHASATVQECWAVTVMEVPGSADVELDLRGYPVIPVQLATFSTPSARCVNVTCWVPSPKSVIFLGGAFVAQELLDFSVTAASLATTHSLPVKRAVVMLLALWGIPVVLEGSVCAGGYCQCLQHVEGPTCSKCKPLYWNLAKENPEGCTGCRCDVGGSLSPVCSQPWGSCRCRAHVVGITCREPEKNYFFPDLHHMKFEIEDGTTVQGGKIRFGYDPQEFPSFSWRGYVRMSSIQPEVVMPITVASPKLFHLVLHYVSLGSKSSKGKISVAEGKHIGTNYTWAAQSKEFVFPPSKEPAFITIPGKSSTEPFSLAPGMWTVSIMAEEVLLVNLEMTINVPQVGRYVLVFEYANEEDQINTAEVTVHSPGPVTEGRVRIYICKYSVVVDDRNRVAAYDLLADTKIRLKASSSNFLLHKVCIISAEEFSPEYVDPKVQCIAAYRSNSDGSAACIPSVFETPPGALVLDAFKDGKISEVEENIIHDSLSATLPAGSVRGVTLTPLQVVAASQIELDISEPMVSVTVMIPDGRMLVLVLLALRAAPWEGSVSADPTSSVASAADAKPATTDSHFASFVDMRNWRLEAVDERTDIPVTFNPVSNSVVADVQELPASVHNLYWKAPPSYLGEKLSSYGGFLSYQVKSFGLPSEGMVLLDKKPDIRLTGKQMEVVYMDPNNPLPDRHYYGRVQLVEGSFRHAGSGKLVSREELMTILSRLDGLHIRALYFTETQRLTLGEVGLEEATGEGSGSIAHSVEVCACPPEYAGDSCQECGIGFYRENKGIFAGRCVPCNCNGNSNRCQDGTGKCIDCQYNTAGEKCEHCKDGYFGDATQGSCRECPCPYTNRFAAGCVANGEEIQCLCKEGYTGARCERCAPGYFGNPQKYGGFCQKCNCNNNGQLASCDHLTGECFNNEPKDVDPNEDCDSCDSCVITLLKDLSTIGDELQLIKSQLQNVHASSHTLEQMRDLETRIKDLKVLLNNYHSVVHNQGSKVDELETEFIKLNRDVDALQEKAEMNYKEAERLFNNFGQTHQKGKDLVSQIQIVVNNIRVLLEQISGTNAEGNNLPLGDASEELAEAQRMMAEMRSRSFGQLQAEAEKERVEAQRLLARIKNELQKYHQENRGLIKVVRDALNDYESKITDLREVLNDATAQIKQAEGLNKDNTVLLEDIKKRIEETNVQQTGVMNILRSARSSLTQAKSVLGLLQESKEEYESLAAQLDGARKDMNEKVANLSSASKEPLVVRAEEHAKSLQDLAKQLEEIKNSARRDELVGCAVEASTAYDNIIGAIKAAEEAANQAGKAADSALSTVKREDLSGKAARLKTESSALMDQAQETKKTLQAIGPNLEDLKQRLDVTDGKTNALKIDLVTAQNNLNGINRGDIDSIITSARSMAENANSVTNSVLGELVPIEAEVERIRSNYGSTQSASFNKALMEANNSVKNLTNQLPDLFSKIKSINQQLMPISNISENINRIRELIQQARDAANKVAIPMRFNGSSGVEVRPPSNLEDLKGYTSLSLFIQRPQQRSDTQQRANRFVLYLGNKNASKDYIGMAVKDGYLTCVYNLGGGDGEVRVQSLVTQSDTEEAVMDQVTFERIYQYAKLRYIKAATSTSPDYESPRSASSGDSDMLLNLDPSSVVFYVGGYPPDFRPPDKLNYPRYEGCIELNSLNEHIVSLYNFKRTFNLNTTEVQPCRRYKEETDQSYFEGTGYASVTAGERSGERVRYEQTIETTADEGIVFFAANGDQFISVLIRNGHRVFRYKLHSETPEEVEAKKTVNDGTYQQINLVLDRRNKVVYVSPGIRANIQVFNFTEYYLGGVPSFLREQFNISTPPFRGCMKNVKNPSTASVVFDKTFGVSKKCSDDWKLVRSAAFSKDGTLSLSAADFPFPKDFQVGFGFQTTASSGTLLNYNLRPDVLSIFLSPGSVTAKIRDKEIKLEKKYEDGSMHYVTVIKIGNRVHMMVDDESKAIDSPRSSSSQESNRPIKFGGDNFEGCISNIFIERLHFSVDVRTRSSRGLIVFMEESSEDSYMALHISKGRFVFSLGSGEKQIKVKTNIKYNDGQWHTNMPMKSFKGCLRNFKMNGKAMNAPQQKNGILPCLDVPMDTGIYFFNEGGYITIGNLLMSVDFKIVFTIRPRSSTGVLLHAGSKQDNYLTVYMKGGKVIAAGNSDAGEFQASVTPKKPLSDGRWHTVAVSQKENTVQLEVGTQSNYTTVLQPSPARRVYQPLYFGKIPANLDTLWLPVEDPFFGCLRNITINDKHVSSRRISEVHGAVNLHGCPEK
ncbi:Laminin subunit alpha-3 [Lonchura striata]|uniref:Laminin subunit alpha-3 n=1 Tax=Lonchura striata TaxID=40157 RepID=A0A218V147_9PASE|nr:Laminin subunit alpha-3 [Lonchura striata domestica]